MGFFSGRNMPTLCAILGAAGHAHETCVTQLFGCRSKIRIRIESALHLFDSDPDSDPDF